MTRYKSWFRQGSLREDRVGKIRVRVSESESESGLEREGGNEEHRSHREGQGDGGMESDRHRSKGQVNRRGDFSTFRLLVH